MREPTPEQKAREAAFLYAGLVDLAVLALQFVCALATLSLTLIGEVVRAGLMILVDFYTYFVLRAVHRQRLHMYRFGSGKLEQMCSLAIGAAIVFGSFWVADRVADTLLYGQAAATPFGLAIAAVVSAINTLANFVGWFAMVSAAKSEDSVIYKSQIRSRAVGLVSSLVVQITLTIAALAEDSVVSIWLDGLGATFVACLMLWIGLLMVAKCIPDLLDHPVSNEMKKRIESALLSAGVAPNELVRTRTRRSGSLPQVELTLTGTELASLADFKQRVAHIQRLIENEIREVDVSIVIDAADR